jgi:hypothetical protein
MAYTLELNLLMRGYCSSKPDVFAEFKISRRLPKWGKRTERAEATATSVL